MARSLALALAVVALAGCGGGSGGSPTPTPTPTPPTPTPKGDDRAMVWCLEKGETLTPAFKRDYPERHMTKAACRFWLTGKVG